MVTFNSTKVVCVVHIEAYHTQGYYHTGIEKQWLCLQTEVSLWSNPSFVTAIVWLVYDKEKQQVWELVGGTLQIGCLLFKGELLESVVSSGWIYSWSLILKHVGQWVTVSVIYLGQFSSHVKNVCIIFPNLCVCCQLKWATVFWISIKS